MICIIGVDGSGKSTHAKIILDKLQKKGFPAKYVWFRYNHIFSVIPLIYCRITGLTVYEKKDGVLYGRHEFYRSCLMSLIYPRTLFIDMLFTYLIKIVIPLKSGKVLVSDRCVYDTLVDLMIDLNNLDFHKTLTGKLFCRLLPRENTKVIFLDADESLIVKRRTDLKYDTTLEKRRAGYQNLARQFDILTITNEGDIHEVNEKICKFLNAR
jgi:thymidylate kinase